MSITKKQLADQVFNKDRADEFLYCFNCGSEHSASSGDYWNLPDNHIFKCPCKKNQELELCIKQITITPKTL